MLRQFPYYEVLSHLRWPQSYLGKLLLISFLGVHVPLLALIGYVAIADTGWSRALPFLIVALLATLIGMLITLIVQWRLLEPVVHTSTALRNYVEQRTLPNLPVGYTDEVGVLMANAQQCMANNEKLLALKNNFLAILSHDLRGPLSNIILLCEILLEDVQSDRRDAEALQRRIGQIRQASVFQLDLMNHIMTLIRSEAGKIEVNRNTIPLDELLQRVQANVKVHAEHKAITCELCANGAENKLLQVDVLKTIQVLNNLLQNAIKFSPPGSRVELDAAVVPDGVEFTVCDNGPGIEAERLPTLFEPFTMMHPYAPTEELTTGLGLWLCKTFVEVQGGQLTVQSTLGQGSRFRVLLPA